MSPASQLPHCRLPPLPGSDTPGAGLLALTQCDHHLEHCCLVSLLCVLEHHCLAGQLVMVEVWLTAAPVMVARGFVCVLCIGCLCRAARQEPCEADESVRVNEPAPSRSRW